MAARFGTWEHYHAQSAAGGKKRAKGNRRRVGSMPAPTAGGCWCGCGQSSAKTVRQRLVVCRGCGLKLRMSRQQMATARLSCGCGFGVLEPLCDLDAAEAGYQDRARELEVRMNDSMLKARIASGGDPESDRRWHEKRTRERARGRRPNTPIQVSAATPAADDCPF